MEYIIRPAELKDIPFLVKTIIEAEKAGTDVLSYTTIFKLTEDETVVAITEMLEQEVDDCEFSVNSFIIAEIDGHPVGALSTWIEGADDMPSSILKGNLLRFCIPSANFNHAVSLYGLLNEVNIDKEKGTRQFGLASVSEEARGRGIISRLFDYALKMDSENDASLEVYLQVFANNAAGIKAYSRYGFEIIETKTCENLEILSYLPSNEKYLMKLKR